MIDFNLSRKGHYFELSVEDQYTRSIHYLELDQLKTLADLIIKVIET